MRALTIAALLLCGSTASAAPLEVWTRAPGQYARKDRPKKQGLVKVEPSKRKTRVLELFDPQYKESGMVRGLELLSLVEPRGGIDMLLLHFDNGMVVPLRVKGEPAPFLALARKTKKGWSSDFPSVPKDKAPEGDPRPIRFKGNKVIGRSSKTKFNPYLHTSSLTGIEMVNERAYYQQFDVSPDPKAIRGIEVYKNYCQHCHGVRGVGASFGWDVVTPVPLYQYRREPDTLYYHVKFRELDAPMRGFMMPALPMFEAAEAEPLWRFLAAMGQKKLRPYHPPGTGPSKK